MSSNFFLDDLAYGRWTGIEYALLGLSLEEVEDSHPISYPSSLEDIQSDAVSGC